VMKTPARSYKPQSETGRTAQQSASTKQKPTKCNGKSNATPKNRRLPQTNQFYTRKVPKAQ
jgi:hypothetical protein